MDLQPAITKEDFDRYIHVSNAQVKTYLTCPQKYELQYVRGLPMEFVPDYLPFGKAIHEAAAFFYRALKETGQKAPVEELTASFTSAWEKDTQRAIRYKEGEDQATLKEKGIQMLGAFYEKVNPRTIIGVEVPFAVDLANHKTGEILPCKLVGIFDLIESDEEGNNIIVELKTGSKRYSEDQIDLDLQGILYSYALQSMGLKPTTGKTLVRYDLLLKLKKPQMESYYVVREPVHYEWAFHLVKRVFKAIEAGAFYPNPGWHCKDCPYGLSCKELR